MAICKNPPRRRTTRDVGHHSLRTRKISSSGPGPAPTTRPRPRAATPTSLDDPLAPSPPPPPLPSPTRELCLVRTNALTNQMTYVRQPGARGGTSRTTLYRIRKRLKLQRKMIQPEYTGPSADVIEQANRIEEMAFDYVLWPKLSGKVLRAGGGGAVWPVLGGVEWIGGSGEIIHEEGEVMAENCETEARPEENFGEVIILVASTTDEKEAETQAEENYEYEDEEVMDNDLVVPNELCATTDNDSEEEEGEEEEEEEEAMANSLGEPSAIWTTTHNETKEDEDEEEEEEEELMDKDLAAFGERWTIANVDAEREEEKQQEPKNGYTVIYEYDEEEDDSEDETEGEEIPLARTKSNTPQKLEEDSIEDVELALNTFADYQPEPDDDVELEDEAELELDNNMLIDYDILSSPEPLKAEDERLMDEALSLMTEELLPLMTKEEPLPLMTEEETLLQKIERIMMAEGMVLMDPPSAPQQSPMVDDSPSPIDESPGPILWPLPKPQPKMGVRPDVNKPAMMDRGKRKKSFGRVTVDDLAKESGEGWEMLRGLVTGW